MISGLWTYQRFIWARAVNDLRHRYSGTGLGIVWNVLHPLALIGIYSVVFTSLMDPPPLVGLPDKFGYTLYLCSGFLPWLALAECVTRGGGAFLDNAPYLKKLPVPEHVFVAQTAASATLGLLISFSLLIVIALALGLRPTWAWLLLPVPLAAMQALGFALGLMLGTINVFLRDVGQLISIGLQVVMWSVPVVYVIDHLPPGVQGIMQCHPLYPGLTATRELFLYGTVPPAWIWAALLGWPAVFLMIASVTYHSLRAEIRDVL